MPWIRVAFRDRFDDYEGRAMLLLHGLTRGGVATHLALYKMTGLRPYRRHAGVSDPSVAHHSADTGDSISDDF